MNNRLTDLSDIVSRFGASFTSSSATLPSRAELEQCLKHFGKVLGKHPLLEDLRAAISEERLVLSSHHAESMSELLDIVRNELATNAAKRREFDYEPNHIPVKERLSNFLFAFALLGYGGLGLKIDDLYIPGKRSSGIHLHGGPAWVMFAAICCAAIVLLATIVDHYDRRDNERHYQATAAWFRNAGWGLFAGAFVLDLYLKFSR